MERIRTQQKAVPERCLAKEIRPANKACRLSHLNFWHFEMKHDKPGLAKRSRLLKRV